MSTRSARCVAMLMSLAAMVASGCGPISSEEVASEQSPVRGANVDARAVARWSPCYLDEGPFECAVVNVPLDHAIPSGAVIQLAVIRLRATDPARRIGSLFFNPGGPGGSGVDFVRSVGAYIYTDEVRARFDVVGFDPRGVERSTALRCFGTERQWWFAPFAYPMNAPDAAVWHAADLYLLDACDQRAARIRDHMSTADVARDLDLLRQAVGDEKLSFAGYSYGSYLGITYAALFPDRFRALVLDGVMDPIAWSVGAPGQGDLPVTTRLRSDAGARETLAQFFALCDAAGAEGCAFAPGSQARYAAIVKTLERGTRIFVELPEGTFRMRLPAVIGQTLGAMYNPFAWVDLAHFLVAVEDAVAAANAEAEAANVGAALTRLREANGFITKRGDPRYVNWAENFYGVMCADSDNPTNWEQWPAAAQEAWEQYGYFGPIWTWASSGCFGWPAVASRYTGSFAIDTAATVLVANARYDCATRYQNAVAVSEMLPNSALLTVDGWGHTTPWLSADADAAVSAYLLTGSPPAQLSFDADYVPFSPLAAGMSGGGALGFAHAARNAFVPNLVPEVVRSGPQ